MITEKISFQSKDGDSGLQCLDLILKHFKVGTEINNSFEFLSNKTHYSLFNEILDITDRLDITSVISEDATIDDIINFNRPLIIDISRDLNTSHFVVCYNFCEKNGFKIDDPFNGRYFASVEGFKSLWYDRKCIAFMQ